MSAGHLTGRQLVAALKDLGVGSWSADAVRQWTREEPPCPIAEHADQGKPHRYRLDQVLPWLRARTMAERAKGYTRSGDGADLLARIEAALRGESRPAVPESTAAADTPLFSAALIASEPGAGVAPEQPAAPSPAKLQVDWLTLADTEALLRVIEGRDPRNWKAAEEAMVIRRERLEAERKLIPLAELEGALEVNVEHTRRGLIAATQALKVKLRDFFRPDSVHAGERAIDEEIHRLLQRLATPDEETTESPTPNA